MEVKIDSVDISPTSLRLGGVVSDKQKTWCRFVLVEVPYSLISWPQMLDLAVAWETAHPRPQEQWELW